MKKYPSIENASSKHWDTILKFYPSEKGRMTFVPTEKLHGANFSIHWIDGEIRYASRERFLDAGETFYGFPNVFADRDIESEVKKYVDELNDCMDEDQDLIKHFIIYGELCGGGYPGFHRSDSVRVQRGVHYAPQNLFIPFDIFTRSGDEDGNLNEGYFADRVTFVGMAEDLKLMYLPSLLRDEDGKERGGTFDECLELLSDEKGDITFNSKIPAIFGLPHIEDNIAEGIVIKPVCDFEDQWGHRFVVKRKNSRFKEKEKAQKKLEKPKEHDVATVMFMTEIARYCNENRLNNVISKIGREESSLTMRDFSELIRKLSSDALEEFKINVGAQFSELTKEKQRVVTKHLSTHCAKVIKAYFIQREKTKNE